MKNLSSKNAFVAPIGTFLGGCGLFVFAAAAILVVFFVPMNMDEAGVYHTLACHDYPFAALHTFRAPCQNQQDLILPFGVHLARSEFYTGLWHSILYAPFYFLLHAPIGQYVFGLCMLFLFAFLIGRETRKPFFTFSIALAFFPFIFQFTHDTGPVSFDILMFPLGAYFFKKIVHGPPALGYGAAIALAAFLFCAVEDKAFFFYLLPAWAFFVLGLTVENESLRNLAAIFKKARGPLIVCAGLTAVLFLLLLFATNDRDQYYFSWLVSLAQKKLAVGEWLNALFDFLFYWPYYAHFTFDLTDDTAGAVIFEIAAAGLLIACAYAGFRLKFFKNMKLRPLCLTLSFISMVVVFFLMGNVWAGHHFVFLWAPLIVLFADLAGMLAPPMAMGIVGAFLALNLWSVVVLTQENVQPRHSLERDAIFSFFSDDTRAATSIINFSSWGGYFIQSLYGPKNQLVTFTEPYDLETANNVPLTPTDAQRLLALSRQTNRTIYNVCLGPACNAPALDAVFDHQLHFVEALPGLPNWHIFVAAPRQTR